MRLFIANCSPQTHIVNVRGPEVGLMQQPIEPGSQIPFGGDGLNEIQIEHIISSYRKYGLRAVDEISRQNAIVPLIFSRDRPVKLEVIKGCIARNRGILFKKGDEIRQMAAIAADKTAVEALNQEPELRSNLHLMEMSVSEDTPGTLPTEGKPINDGHRIEHVAGDSSGYTPPRTRSKRRAA